MNRTLRDIEQDMDAKRAEIVASYGVLRDAKRAVIAAENRRNTLTAQMTALSHEKAECEEAMRHESMVTAEVVAYLPPVEAVA